MDQINAPIMHGCDMVVSPRSAEHQTRVPRFCLRALAFLASMFVLCMTYHALAQSFRVVEPSDGFLSAADGEVTARLRHGACEPGYEEACATNAQLQRSEYLPALSHAHGYTVEYSWGILVPEDFVYQTVSSDLRAGRLYNNSVKPFCISCWTATPD